MERDRRMSRLAIAVAAVLCLAAASGGPASAAETRALAALDELGRLDLQVADGKVTGAVERRPVAEVLQALRDQVDFDYEADDEILGVLLTRRFDAVPLTDALIDLLGAFNYTMTFAPDGAVKQLRISGLRGDPADVLPPAAPAGSAESAAEPEAIQLAPGTELTEAQARLFEEAEQEVAVPAELHEQFYPEQPPGSEETGPPEPETSSLEISDFTPFESDSGPPGPDLSTMELPDFIPEENETGPTRDPFGQ